MNESRDHGGRSDAVLKRLVVGAGLLILLAASTLLAGHFQQRSIQRNGDRIALENVDRTLERIRSNLNVSFRELGSEADAMASDRGLINALSRRERDGSQAVEEIVRIITGQDIKPFEALEIYDPVPALLAWRGPSLPLDDAPERLRFLDQVTFSMVRDRNRRTALVAWVPVRDGSSVVGAVRASRIIENRVPLQNEFLRDFTWDERYSRLSGLKVVFHFGRAVGSEDEAGSLAPTGRRTYALEAPDGTPIGVVDIELPDPSNLAAEANGKVRDTTWFWIVLATVLLTWAAVRAVLRGEPGPGTLVAILTGFGLWLTGIRILFMMGNVPGRWQPGKAPLAPLFDPRHLASGFAFGTMKTSGDLVLTSIFIMVFASVVISASAGLRTQLRDRLRFGSARRPGLRVTCTFLVHFMLSFLLLSFVYRIAGHAVLDSTLTYFDRTNLLPEPLVLTVIAALLLLLFSVIMVATRMLWLLSALFRVDSSDVPQRLRDLWRVLVPALVLPVAFYMIPGSSGFLPPSIVAAGLPLIYGLAFVGPLKSSGRSPLAALRLIAPAVVILSVLLYPMLQASAAEKRRLRIEDAAATFLEERDARVMFAISQILDRVEDVDFDTAVMTTASGEPETARGDSLAAWLVDDMLFAGLESHRLTVTIHSGSGAVLGRYTDSIRRVPNSMLLESDHNDFGLLASMYRNFGGRGPMIEKITGSGEQDRFRYVGFRRISGGGAYVMVRAEQNPFAEAGTTPFPSVLVPSGYYGDRYSDLSIAEFRDGVLIRSRGQNFGRTHLDPEVVDILRSDIALWRTETVRDQPYLTYYLGGLDQLSNAGATVVAVREPVINVFDHLFYLLRVIVAGLILALPVYAISLVSRGREEIAGEHRPRFRDRVLNAFFAVGMITVIATGFVGLRVVTGENERAVESWLRQHLERVNETLRMEAVGEELPYSVLEKMSVDSLALRTGLDINIYHGTELERSSRPELVRDRLIEPRLPIEAYESLVFDGFRFVTVQERLGTFAYTAGYQALTDERGLPHYVVSVPTLPEQERIEEERARTVAYLFGALLLLMLVVMVTASLLADALTRPIARLRTGLQAVAAGHFERIQSVGSGDEIDQLVDSFNAMQDQLEESRALLAQQERQLAWREMARQVAHEIKNPLTPMKLSIQHLRSAYQRRREDGSDQDGFNSKFSRTTTTLIEQIDTLARIANEFSSFGRMPTHIREEVDLNDVIREAADLMRAEDHVRIDLNLAPTSVVVNGDREALRRMYVNFLKNAVQAVPEGREAIIVMQTQIDPGDDVELRAVSRVTDNGSGIPQQHRDRIFVPSFSTKTSGTGLGLAIARKTVESMDGQIGFDSTPGEGTTFWVRLPLRDVPPSDAD